MQPRYTTIANYCDAAGVEHEVAVDVDAGGRFRVIDVAADETLLVELLRGFDDTTDRAIACAQEYARIIGSTWPASAPTCPSRTRSGAAR